MPVTSYFAGSGVLRFANVCKKPQCGHFNALARTGVIFSLLFFLTAEKASLFNIFTNLGIYTLNTKQIYYSLIHSILYLHMELPFGEVRSY